MRTVLIVMALALVGCAASLEDPDEVGGSGSGSGGGDGMGSGSGSGMGSGSGSGSGSMGMPLAAYLDALGKIECDEAFTCKATWPSATEGPFEDSWGTTIAECYTAVAAYFDVATYQALVASGNLTYDSVAAQMCIAGFTAPECSTYWTEITWPEVCWDALYGSTPDGGTCTVSFECAGQASYCDEQSLTCTP